MKEQELIISESTNLFKMEVNNYLKAGWKVAKDKVIVPKGYFAVVVEKKR